MNLTELHAYFPSLTEKQVTQLGQLPDLYREWNGRINVISRKDEDNILTHHVCHGLALAKVVQFEPGARVLDIGTGGGFPGIPLAIMFPETEFVLVDSIAKKIKVVQAVADALELTNVSAIADRAEKIPGKFPYVVSRAVARVAKLMPWIKGKMELGNRAEITGGIYLLKGGDGLQDELDEAKQPGSIINLNTFFKEEFFETKKIVAITKLSPRYT